MKILQVHNQYRARGGEDVVLDLEFDLLRERGHQVERFIVSNESLVEPSLRTGIETVWSHRSNKKLLGVLREIKPDLMHVHNTFPQLSPSVYWAAAAEGVPVVQTLHNYRLACAEAAFLRDGKPCELCVERMPWPALRYKCYRDSLAGTGAIVTMQVAHRALGTYKDKVDAYITLTEFARSIMLRSGLPAERVHVKPNFVPDPLPSFANLPKRRNQIVFVGRLVVEKGVDLLLDAWARLKPSGTRLTIVGDGPEKPGLQEAFGGLPGVEWRGWMSQEEVLREIAMSQYLVISSKAYEGFPMSVVEAMSVGTPVLAPDHAGFPEAVAPGQTGFLFRPGDSEDLAEKLSTALISNSGDWLRMSKQARNTYLERYTPEVNYSQLMAVYEKAIEQAQDRGQP